MHRKTPNSSSLPGARGCRALEWGLSRGGAAAVPGAAGLSIMCGAIGYLGSLAFVRRIFRNVKVD